jgi:hypothetical protein
VSCSFTYADGTRPHLVWAALDHAWHGAPAVLVMDEDPAEALATMRKYAREDGTEVREVPAAEAAALLLAGIGALVEHGSPLQFEPAFPFPEQQLGWDRPKLRDPAAAGRWTWIVLACYAQLRLARTRAADIRLSWQQPCPPGRLTPAASPRPPHPGRLTPAASPRPPHPGRVRRGYRSLRQILLVPASAPKPARPGPGRPLGSKDRRAATRYDVGKTVKRTETTTKNQQAGRLNNKPKHP